MWHRIAMMQGRTVEEARTTNTAREFVELCALWRVQPWGPERDAWHTAAVCKALAEAFGKARPGGYQLADFLVRFGAAASAQTPAEMRRILRQAASLAGAQVHGDDHGMGAITA